MLTRLAGTRDIRTIGSGNIGATNVLRTGRKGLAAATLLGDVLKGTVAVLIGGYMAGPNGALVAALGAFLGHLFPVWLSFKGGKGVATYIGVLLGLLWPAAHRVLRALARGRRCITRYSSLSALIASLATPFVLWSLGQPALAVLFAVLTAALAHASRNMHGMPAGSNIGARLIAGTEPHDRQSRRSNADDMSRPCRPQAVAARPTTQRLDWLRLIRSENVGPRTFRSLLNHYGSARAALERPARSRAPRRRVAAGAQSARARRPSAKLTAARRIGVSFVALGETGYPRAARRRSTTRRR